MTLFRNIEKLTRKSVTKNDTKEPCFSVRIRPPERACHNPVVNRMFKNRTKTINENDHLLKKRLV